MLTAIAAIAGMIIGTLLVAVLAAGKRADEQPERFGEGMNVG